MFEHRAENKARVDYPRKSQKVAEVDVDTYIVLLS